MRSMKAYLGEGKDGSADENVSIKTGALSGVCVQLHIAVGDANRRWCIFQTAKPSLYTLVPLTPKIQYAGTTITATTVSVQPILNSPSKYAD